MCAVCGDSNTTLVKVKFQITERFYLNYRIQIQHLLKLNPLDKDVHTCNPNSNTTLVKVKF